MDIFSIDYYRDCATAGVKVIIDNAPEPVEYLIHGNNFGNDRFDVTRDGWGVQNYPSLVELQELSHALSDFKYTGRYQGWQRTEEEINYLEVGAHRLAGMVSVFRHWLKNQTNPPTKAIVHPRVDVVQEVQNKLMNQIAEMMENDVLERMRAIAIADGKLIFAPMPEGGFIKLEKTDETE